MFHFTVKSLVAHTPFGSATVHKPSPGCGAHFDPHFSNFQGIFTCFTCIPTYPGVRYLCLAIKYATLTRISDFRILIYTINMNEILHTAIIGERESFSKKKIYEVLPWVHLVERISLRFLCDINAIDINLSVLQMTVRKKKRPLTHNRSLNARVRRIAQQLNC